jgi:magnesium transporter
VGVRTAPGQSVAAEADRSYKDFETAAAHASKNVPMASTGMRAGDVRSMLAGHQYESASHVVICEEERFAGIATIETILGAPPDATMASLMDAEPPVVAPGIDQEVAAWRAVRQGESALAVVDHGGRFVGVIPPHRLVAVLLAEHEEDLSRLGGFLKGASTARMTSEEPVRRRFWHRLPWLLLGLCGALFAADLIGRFEDVLRANVVLAFFLPGIVYLADAVGTQTETVIVRGLSLGVPMRHMVARELVAGIVIGVALGTIASPLVWWLWQDADLALSVGVSVFAAASTSTVAAMLLPWTLERVGLDPAFGSGPLATVIQDLLSIYIYLIVTTVMIA